MTCGGSYRGGQDGGVITGRQSSTAQFKARAARQAVQGGQAFPQVTDDLGTHPPSLRDWKECWHNLAEFDTRDGAASGSTLSSETALDPSGRTSLVQSWICLANATPLPNLPAGKTQLHLILERHPRLATHTDDTHLLLVALMQLEQTPGLGLA
jgi:transposase-like protein